MAVKITETTPKVTFTGSGSRLRKPPGTPKNWNARVAPLGRDLFDQETSGDVLVWLVPSMASFRKNSPALVKLVRSEKNAGNYRLVIGIDQTQENEFEAMDEIVESFPEIWRTRIELALGKERILKEAYEAILKARSERSSSRSGLFRIPAVGDAVAHLRTDDGKLSATLVADCFGITLTRLANQLDMKKQTISKTPDSKTMQSELLPYERIAQLLVSMSKKEFHAWLNRKSARLEDQSPLEVLDRQDLEIDKFEAVANMAESRLTGAPA